MNSYGKIRIFFSIILYKSPIDILLKSLYILSQENNRFEYNFIIIDNDNGIQIQILKMKVNQLFDMSFSEKFTYLSSINTGFATANNLAFSKIQDIDFEYICFLNPDGIIHHQAMDRLVDKSISIDDQGIFEVIQTPTEHPKIYDPMTLETNWCSGACLMIPKDIFVELQGFDSMFFMYLEDVDLSWRARLAGYKCYTVQDAIFMHSVDRSVDAYQLIWRYLLISGLKLSTKYENKNFFYFCKRKLKQLIGSKKSGAIIQNLNIMPYKFDLLAKNNNIIDFNNKFFFLK